MNRLKELRQKNNLTLKELGEQVGLANNTLSQYENGKREPKMVTWLMLARFYGVSIPYLQGLTYGQNSFASKDYFLSLINDMYKENWTYTGNATNDYLTNVLKNINFIDDIKTICRARNIKLPNSPNIDFWINNFDFLFDIEACKMMFSTGYEFDDDDMQNAILQIIHLIALEYKQVLEKNK